MRRFLSLIAILLSAISLFAQTKTTTGRITDQQGQPVPFATVVIKGTKTAASADADGNFSIKAKSGDILVVSGAGMTAKEATVTGSGPVNVQVSRKESNMTEVVVTALGIQRQAKELGYSTAKVTGKELTQAKPISAVNGLTGKVSGLQISTTNNGVFAPTRVTLRGNRSLTGNNQPLIIVDGAIYYNDLSTINAEDITDITVLKGSSASAVYGSDASNGVILVTTKKGVRGRPNLTFSSTVQMESVAYMPKFQTRFGANGGEYFVNDFNDLSTMVPYENQAYGPEFRAGAMVPIGRVQPDSSYLLVPYVANPNQKKDFFDHSITTQNSLSYAAGDDVSRFYLSAQDVNTKGVMPGDLGRRDAFRVSGSRNYGIFSADYTLAYTYKYTNVTNQATTYDNLLNTPSDVPLSMMKDWAHGKFATINAFFNDYYDNPYWTIGNIRNKTKDNNLSGNMHLQLKPVSWLTLSYRLALTNLGRKFDFTQADKTYSNYAIKNTLIYYSNPDGTGVIPVTNEGAKYNASHGSQANYYTYNFNNFLVTSDFVATFDHNLSKDFNLKATIGTTYMDNQINNQYINANALFFPVYNVNNLTGSAGLGNTNNTTTQSNYTEEARRLGFFGEATVGYKNFAFLHGSYRTDIDSRLSKDNRYIPYYDGDASVVISDLIPSIANGKVVNFVKLRAAHSLTGNVSALASGSSYIADGAYKTVGSLVNANSTAAGQTIGFPYNGLGGFQLNTTIANPNIKPEKVTENEIGLEMSFLQNRITFVGAVYESKLKDGIVYATIPNSSGFTQALVNAANTSNKGIEAEVKGTVLKSGNVTWNLGINYTYNKSKVISINGGQKSLGLGTNGNANTNAYAVLGQPFPVVEAYDWVRDSLGHVIVDGVTGAPSRDPNLKVMGQATPKHILGITSTVVYKNWTFSATADYRAGYKILNQIGSSMDFSGNGYVSAITGRQRFVFPNSVILQGGKYVPNTNVTVNDASFNFWPSLYNSVNANYVTSAAAWKLREVAVSYDFPRKWIAPTRVVQHATLTVSGRNLLMIRPKSNIWTDPEYSEDTSNAVGRTGEGQTPPTRIVSATLSIQF
ncbi:MAG: SusC/RagA family TonB-linked outer membrane protein [Bacteroidetes bacterium]|nr:SusC/RagA family TonB-linked outer membrane protein [Bacteroidota bacterium]